jgi:hypothetical protein
MLNQLFGVRAPRGRGHPSNAEAAEALLAGDCMYRLCSAKCSPRLRSVGLRDNDDSDVVLVCSGHYGRLRQMPPDELDDLARALHTVFERLPEEP